MKKRVHDYLYEHFPRIWFALKYHVENEYQDYLYARNELTAYGQTASKLLAMGTPFSEAVRGHSFLDLGCDTGFFPIHAAMIGATSALGIDRNARALSKAGAAATIIGVRGVGFKLATIPNIDLESRVDTVLFSSAIHYMFSDKAGNDVLFDTMRDFVDYIGRYVGESLFIEFVAPDDPAIVQVVSDRFLASGEYSEARFMAALNDEFKSVSFLGTTHRDTRKMFLART